MPVVTVRGQMGSGAPEIGKIIAEKIHADYIDREIIADVAKRLKRSKQGITDKEKPASTLWGRIAEALARGYPVDTAYPSAYLPMYEIPIGDAQYLTGLKSVIEDLASSQAVVIRGRGSQFILKDFPGALHVLVVADEKIRIERIMASLKLSQPAAAREMSRSDSSHREFVRRYFQADLEDPINYDLVVNTSILGFEATGAIIIKALQEKQKSTKGSGRIRRTSRHELT
jgi:cytidylate kinase